jgi:hypothetical protein
MPQITRSTLATKLAELEQAEQQARATLNAIAGARQVLASLQSELDMPTPPVDAPSKD